MATTKVAVTIDTELLQQLDQLVASHVFANRSKAIQVALRNTLVQLRHERLAVECAKLNPNAEQALAEEGIELELAKWPEY
jgi:metal-responsive CopG/Arc/MetJ family transcriptional regulator